MGLKSVSNKVLIIQKTNACIINYTEPNPYSKMITKVGDIFSGRDNM